MIELGGFCDRLKLSLIAGGISAVYVVLYMLLVTSTNLSLVETVTISMLGIITAIYRKERKKIKL